MAEGILKSLLPERLQDRVRVISAGTLGLISSPASTDAIAAMQERGIDISAHLSQGLTASLIKESQIVFAMAREHIDYIYQVRPELAEGIFLLRAFDKQVEEVEDTDIADPIGLDIDTYRAARDLLQDEIERILPRLVEKIDRYFHTEE
jgi:protein-tyrosine-phosphatase